MAITVKFKAKKMTAKTKDDLLYELKGGGAYFEKWFVSNGRYLKNQNGTARLYSLEKHNTKTKWSRRLITRGKRKGEIEKTREVIKDSCWIAYYYDIPENMIDRTRTVQHERNFTVKMK